MDTRAPTLTQEANNRATKALDLVVFDGQFDKIAKGECDEVFRPVSSFWKHRLRNRAFEEAEVRTNSSRGARRKRFEVRGITETIPPGLNRKYYAIQLGRELT